MAIRKKGRGSQQGHHQSEGRRCVWLSSTSLFDVSQSEGAVRPYMHQVFGNPGENLERLAAFVRSRGITFLYNANIATAPRYELWRTHRHSVRTVQGRRVFTLEQNHSADKEQDHIIVVSVNVMPPRLNSLDHHDRTLGDIPRTDEGD